MDYTSQEKSTLASFLVQNLIQQSEPDCMQVYCVIDEVVDLVKQVIADLESHEVGKGGKGDDDE